MVKAELEPRNDRVQLTNEEEKVLVEKAILGNPESFGQLYKYYRERIFRRFYYTYNIRNPKDAEDLTEQVFLNAWRVIERYEPRAKFANWLLSIARNEMRGYFYRQIEEPVDAVLRMMAGDSSDPVIISERNDEIIILREAILALRTDWQKVVLMYYRGGMTHSEIGEAIGKTGGASRSILHKALLSLRKSMDVKEASKSVAGNKEEKDSERKFTYEELSRMTGIRHGLLCSKVSRALKAGRIQLSPIRGAIRRSFTENDIRTILEYLKLEPLLLVAYLETV